ncbi:MULTISPECIES: GntR family transcriptional regulator [unclassified Curtobacterium]|uniref:GntR family transcriptional regulator n=1 Tax=unclassified Curtobacterium TaxID=257496 RepID=UPI0015E8B3EE|nr:MULTISPECIES: GntR family transcriptional regulator [unclassified Curtobacterium]
MPVPRSPASQGPRRLLRDVVYEQTLEAIENGTLEAGERLNDEELTSWLGVSRTPVREAIARLESEGLVEMGREPVYARREPLWTCARSGGHARRRAARAGD